MVAADVNAKAVMPELHTAVVVQGQMQSVVEWRKGREEWVPPCPPCYLVAQKASRLQLTTNIINYHLLLKLCLRYVLLSMCWCLCLLVHNVETAPGKGVCCMGTPWVAWTWCRVRLQCCVMAKSCPRITSNQDQCGLVT